MTPQLQESRIREILSANNINQRVASVFSIRGYYLDSLGKPKINDRGIYDDATFIIWPDGIARFLSNTDPSSYRKGKGTGAGKGMAVLKPGKYTYGTGRHRGALAFRQVRPVTVLRDGNPPYEDTGHFAINIHSGGGKNTSSEGCQTLPAESWDTFRSLLYKLLVTCNNRLAFNDRREFVPSFEYLLAEETELREGNLASV